MFLPTSNVTNLICYRRCVRRGLNASHFIFFFEFLVHPGWCRVRSPSVWRVCLFRLQFTREEWWLNFRGSISMQQCEGQIPTLIGSPDVMWQCYVVTRYCPYMFTTAFAAAFCYTTLYKCGLALTIWAISCTLFNIESLSYTLSTHFEALYMNKYHIGLSDGAMLRYMLRLEI